MRLPLSLLRNIKEYASAYNKDGVSDASRDLLEKALGKDITDAMDFPVAVKQFVEVISVLERRLGGQGIAAEDVGAIVPLYSAKQRIDEIYKKLDAICPLITELRKYVSFPMPLPIKGASGKEKK